MEELAETCADRFRGTVGDLKDRVHEKLARLGLPVPVRRAEPSQDGGHVISPAIRMRFSEWTTDENGVRGRVIYNAADTPPP